jgi:hypothetical protein
VTIETRILCLADRISVATGLGTRALEADSLIEAALARAPDAAFGADADSNRARNSLRQLCDALDQEAGLSLVGRLAARWDALRCLGNLLRLREEERRRPEIAGVAIDRPLIITGLPRSGTTFLHRLLDCDAANLSPSCWQVMAPYPPRRGADRRIRATERQLQSFARLAPDFRSVHPLSAGMPQECTEITAQVFQSLRYDTTFRIPSYLAWLDAEGHREAYRFHKRFLQHLQFQRGETTSEMRWVLKCPDHVFALDAVRAVYPDARIVFVHRDPPKVLASVARLTEILRGPFARVISREEIGNQVAARWEQGARAMIAAAPAGRNGGDGIFHVQYKDFARDPLAAIKGLYQYFDMPLGELASSRMAAEVANRPRGGYGANIYDLRDHGLELSRERARFLDYTAHFDIAAEAQGV